MFIGAIDYPLVRRGAELRAKMLRRRRITDASLSECQVARDIGIIRMTLPLREAITWAAHYMMMRRQYAAEATCHYFLIAALPRRTKAMPPRLGPPPHARQPGHAMLALFHFSNVSKMRGDCRQY